MSSRIMPKAEVKVKLTQKKAQDYTWKARAGSIISFIFKKKRGSDKANFWPALAAGMGIAAFSIPILKNISKSGNLFFLGRGLTIFVILSWIIAVSAAAVAGVYIAEIMGRRKTIVFQITKYGLVGWLNFFIYAGIFNLFSWISGIASGLFADLFLLVAFIATTINGFFWNKFWTFKSENKNKTREYISFFSVTSISSILRIVLFHFIVNIIKAPVGMSEEIWANIAIFGLIPVSLIGNFLGYKFFVFNRKM